MTADTDSPWQRYTVSAELLARDDMAAALRGRDFGAAFLLMRKWDHVSQDRIASSVEGFSQSRVSRIAGGKAKVEDVDVIERIADGLRIPGAMVGLAPRPWEVSGAVGAAPHPPRETLRVPTHLREQAGAAFGAPPAAPRRDEVTDSIRQLLACIEPPAAGRGGRVELPPFDLESKILGAWSSGRPREGSPVLVMVAGFPGSGKTEFARFLCEITGWSLLDKDTMSRPLTESLLLSLDTDPNDRQGETYTGRIRPLEYRAMFDTAFDNLRLGLPTVVTAPFVRELTDPAWLERMKKRCANAGAAIAVVWLRCDIDSQRDYLESRDAARDTWKLSYWEEYVATIDPDQRPVCTHYVVDNSRHARSNLAEHARRLASRIRDAS
ncbi:putative kinase [Frankia sp. AiPs1]|uniref:AAA family ATPase n=1 Tax=Frankia sp. AiPa1 TaxID=573492 RepID=UPI00202AE2B2|nr:ATP-binding protein [Frankia sp. AiPa1]MCL9758997.1 ATP-binding protein [Frankia sp. AiPa1]